MNPILKPPVINVCVCVLRRDLNIYLLSTYLLVLGGELLLRHEQDGVRRVDARLHPEDPVHHPGLRHQHQEAQTQRPDLRLGGTRQLLPRGIRDGKYQMTKTGVGG